VRALVLTEPGRPLEERELPVPERGEGEVLVRVAACGVCRTDLHIVDGELPDPKLPLVLGHQIVGRIEGTGERVGIPWLGWTDGECRYCLSGRENLCDSARFTGYHRDGGYAEYTVADRSFCLPLPDDYGDVEAAPLLCAGLIGYRALRFTGEAERLGLYGFGASAHLGRSAPTGQAIRPRRRRRSSMPRSSSRRSERSCRSPCVHWPRAASSSAPAST
jgi:alcohol dehydrogenase, propanol-preferring